MVFFNFLKHVITMMLFFAMTMVMLFFTLMAIFAGVMSLIFNRTNVNILHSRGIRPENHFPENANQDEAIEVDYKIDD